MHQLRSRWLLLACIVSLSVVCGSKKNKNMPLKSCQLPFNLTDPDNNSSGITPPLLYYETLLANSSSCTHYVWSTHSFPTLFISQTDTGRNDSKCSCTGFHYNATEFVDNQSKGSVNIPGSDGESVLALIFTRVVEFKVKERDAGASNVFNTSDLTSEGYASKYLNNSNLTWSYFPASKTFRGVDDITRTGNDTVPYFFSITHTIPTEMGSHRLPQFPKTQYTPNSTVFDIVIENPLYTLSYNSSRIALEVLVVHGPNVTNGSVNISKTVDDEYTPSVFRAFTYLFGNDGYFQWKPISYQSRTRQTTKAQQANMVFSAPFEEDIPPSLASAVFGRDSSVLNVSRWFVVIGTAKNDGYLCSNFSTWTAVVGFGEVPQDSISFVIIITIIVGFGVPMVLVVFGGIYVVYKKKPWLNVHRLFAKLRQRQTYSRLN